MQFVVPILQNFGGLLTWMQSTDLLNFITEDTPEQEAILELETFLLRLTSDFMSNHGQVAQMFFYNLNKTIMEVVPGSVIPLEQFLIETQDAESMMQLQSIITGLKNTTLQIQMILGNYSAIRDMFQEPNNPLLENYPPMTETTHFVRYNAYDDHLECYIN